MRRGRLGRAVATAAVVAALATGCAPAAGDPDGGWVVVDMPRPTTALLPSTADDPTALAIADAIYGSLVGYAEDGSPVPDLAESIETADSTVFHVTIREGAEFADGTPVTSQSFVGAWNYAALTGQPSRELFAPIQGFDPERDVNLEGSGGLRVVDDRSFDIVLGAPQADFPLRLGLVAFAPLPVGALDDPAAFARHPYGAGPYRLSGSATADDLIELRPSAGYAGARIPVNDGVQMRFSGFRETAYADLLNGEVEMMTNLPAAAVSSRDPILTRHRLNATTAVSYALVVPTSLPHFGGEEGHRRREAISRTIDRDAVIAAATRDDRARALGFAPLTVYGALQLPLGPAEVVSDQLSPGRLWRDADETDKWVEEEEPFTIAYDRDSTDRDLLAYVADRLAEALPMRVRLVAVNSEADWRARLADRSLLAAYLRVDEAAYPSVREFLDPDLRSGDNPARYQNRAYDRSLNAADAAHTLADARDQYSIAQQRLARDIPIIPLWTGAVTVAVSDAVAPGFGLDWRGVPELWTLARLP